MSILIKSSAVIRNNYNEISALCKETREPVILTKNEEGDLAVLDLNTFESMRATMDLREKMDMVEEARKSGMKDVKARDTIDHMREAIKHVLGLDSTQCR